MANATRMHPISWRAIRGRIFGPRGPCRIGGSRRVGCLLRDVARHPVADVAEGQSRSPASPAARAVGMNRRHAPDDRCPTPSGAREPPSHSPPQRRFDRAAHRGAHEPIEIDSVRSAQIAPRSGARPFPRESRSARRARLHAPLQRAARSRASSSRSPCRRRRRRSRGDLLRPRGLLRGRRRESRPHVLAERDHAQCAPANGEYRSARSPVGARPRSGFHRMEVRLR